MYPGKSQEMVLALYPNSRGGHNNLPLKVIPLLTDDHSIWIHMQKMFICTSSHHSDSQHGIIPWAVLCL